MARNRKTKSYPAEFREKAVRLVSEGGYTFEQVSKQLGCSTESVRRWNEVATHKLGPETDRLEREENKRLRKEVAQLRTENEILNKATAYFAREIM